MKCILLKTKKKTYFKNILLTPLADNLICFKQNVLNLVVFFMETRLKSLSNFAYLVKVS